MMAFLSTQALKSVARPLQWRNAHTAASIWPKNYLKSRRAAHIFHSTTIMPENIRIMRWHFADRHNEQRESCSSNNFASFEARTAVVAEREMHAAACP